MKQPEAPLPDSVDIEMYRKHIGLYETLRHSGMTHLFEQAVRYAEAKAADPKSLTLTVKAAELVYGLAYVASHPAGITGENATTVIREKLAHLS